MFMASFAVPGSAELVGRKAGVDSKLQAHDRDGMAFARE